MFYSTNDAKIIVATYPEGSYTLLKAKDGSLIKSVSVNYPTGYPEMLQFDKYENTFIGYYC